MDKLELLSLSKDFEVEKKDNGYKVYHKHSDLFANINENKEIHYYIDDVNTRSVEIEMNNLNKLKEFCELMVK